MNYRNSQVLIASSLKLINKARVTGKLDTQILHIFKIFDYYINYTQEAITNGDLSYQDTNSLLKKNIQMLWYDYPNIICNYKITSSLDNPTNTTNTSILNTPPTISGNTISITTNTQYIFTLNDLVVNYYDANNNGYKDIKIFPATLTGTLYYNNTLISSPLIISVNDISKLKYIRPNNNILTDSFNIAVGDNNPNQLFSTQVTITMTGTAIITNQPATIGDNTIYAENRETTVLTLAMFTSQLAPPYNDPEGDLLDAIRIDTIGTANNGKYYLNGIEIVVGQIITREDLSANLFTHVGANTNDISSDTFTFSVRDEGSQIWIN